jgi:hypothetical protein
LLICTYASTLTRTNRGPTLFQVKAISLLAQVSPAWTMIWIVPDELLTHAAITRRLRFSLICDEERRGGA